MFNIFKRLRNLEELVKIHKSTMDNHDELNWAKFADIVFELNRQRGQLEESRNAVRETLPPAAFSSFADSVIYISDGVQTKYRIRRDAKEQLEADIARMVWDGKLTPQSYK